MKTITEIEWAFGGFLKGAWSGWIILALLFIGGLFVAYLNYRKPVLLPYQRCVLFCLRAIFYTGLVICLANPTRVERHDLDPSGKRPVAVVIDGSASMTQADNRGRSRLTGSLQIWRGIRAEVEKHFGKITFSSFAKKRIEAPTLEAALAIKQDDDETLMFDSLGSVLASAPNGGYGAILCLTDAVDTSLTPPVKLVSQALQSHTPLYFLPGINRLQPHEFLQIREVDVPIQVVRKTQFNYEAVIEAYSEHDKMVTCQLLVDNQPVATESLQFKAGHNLLPWSHKIQTNEPGRVRLELRLGEGLKEAVNTVPVVDKIGVNLLYYQGALDWGFQFISGVLKRDPSFEITALFNPSVITRAHSVDALKDIPETAQELARYQIVVLANVFASQLSPAQQHALEDYTRNGGGLLFLLPNNTAAMAFAGSPLEAMLPVVFEGTTPQNQHDATAESFQQKMRQIGGGVDFMAEHNFAQTPSNRTGQSLLLPFAFPENSPLAELFKMRSPTGDEKIVPMFSEYAKIQRAKAGAEVLAVHPTAKNERTGEPRILLATQTYGKGHSSVLSTDSLWRWRMSLPADSVAASTFWQQLFYFLAQSSASDRIHFLEKITETSLKKTAHLTVVTRDTAPVLTAVGPDHQTIPIAVKQGLLPHQWEIDWTPAQLGLWTINAQSGSDTAQCFLHVSEPVDFIRDLANLPPALEQMRELSGLTGGALIEKHAPAAWKSEVDIPKSQLLWEHRELMWNHWWVLMTCFFVYSTELLLRRRWRMI